MLNVGYARQMSHMLSVIKLNVVVLSVAAPCCHTVFSPSLMGVGQNGQISFRKTGKEDCGYMVCESKIFFVPSEKYEPSI